MSLKGDERRRVKVELTAYLNWTDDVGGAQVDADGVEFYVEPSEWSEIDREADDRD